MSDEADKLVARPRWARELGDATWNAIHEMLDAGHKTMDIARELHIPESKFRSLQEHVRRQGPRRRLIRFAEFKNALLSQIEKLGEEMAQALTVTAALAVSNETPPAAQIRAVEVMTKYAEMIKSMAAEDAKTESERQRDERMQGGKMSPAEAIAEALDRYGKTVDGS